jgi:hypothetical protein
MDNKWTKLSLRVLSTSTTAEQLESRFGVQAGQKGNIGDPISRRSPQAGQRQASICIFDCPIEDAEGMERHFDWLEHFLITREAVIRSLPPDCVLDAWLGLSSPTGQAGAAILARHLKQLGDLKIDLVLDVYLSGSESD